jgi:hypothetical protein
VAQLVVINAILLAQRNAKDALADQPRNLVHQLIGGAMVAKTVRKPLDQPDRPVGGSQHQPAGIRGHPAAVKSGDHRTPLDARKAK